MMVPRNFVKATYFGSHPSPTLNKKYSADFGDFFFLNWFKFHETDTDAIIGS